jgi:AraC-like DNA-binding protein
MTALPRTGRWKLSPGALKYVVQEWLVGWNQWCQFIGKNGPFFEHVRLGYSASGERSHYADHLGCTVSFDNNETTGFFAARWLEQPLEFANGAIAALCAAQCERLLEVIDGRVGLAAEIHRRLANSPGIVASMDEMANGLHVGVRTLRRRLKNEGTTYQDVVREFRVGMAKRYLQETELPANEIALLVGYSDPGTLYRVFLDMTGQTPREFRDTIGRE